MNSTAITPRILLSKIQVHGWHLIGRRNMIDCSKTASILFEIDLFLSLDQQNFLGMSSERAL